MYLSKLKLTQFKNYEARTFEFSPRLNCITGLNGVGKTNILDAIHYACLTKSHRALADKHLILHGQDFFRLEADFAGADASVKIVLKYPVAQRKELERNGITVAKMTDYLGQFPVVMVAPDDIALVQEGSEERRRYMDNTLSQSDSVYLQHLLHYNALLRQRNALLKDFAAQRYFDATLLESLDRQLPIHAIPIIEKRQAFAAQVAPLVSTMYDLIAGQREQVEIRYDTDGAIAANYSERLAASLEKDRLLERTNVGPHKDDLEFVMEDQVLKRFASQGQLKSFLLALRLAQFEVLRQDKLFAPILLLDDIFDKLDKMRVRQLMSMLLEGDFGQIFITDTQRERLEQALIPHHEEAVFFEID